MNKYAKSNVPDVPQSTHVIRTDEHGLPSVRVAQVEEQFKCLEGAIQRMERAAHTITERISSVVKYAPVEENDAVEAPEPMLVPLASDLRNYARELNGIAARLEDVGSRVEL